MTKSIVLINEEQAKAFPSKEAANDFVTSAEGDDRIQSITVISSAKDLEDYTISGLVDTYNNFSKEPVKKFPSKANGSQRLYGLLTELTKEGQAVRKDTIVDTTPPTPSTRTKRNQIIKLLVSENPKTQGSASFKRFAKYKDGMSVQEFIKVGGSLNDVNYDKKKEFIKLVDPS